MKSLLMQFFGVFYFPLKFSEYNNIYYLLS